MGNRVGNLRQRTAYRPLPLRWTGRGGLASSRQWTNALRQDVASSPRCFASNNQARSLKKTAPRNATCSADRNSPVVGSNFVKGKHALRRSRIRMRRALEVAASYLPRRARATPPPRWTRRGAFARETGGQKKYLGPKNAS